MAKLNETLSNLGLRRLLAAQVPADFADWLDYVAIASLLAFTWNSPPVAFAFFAVCLGLPYLIIGPFAGVIVDRTQLKHVLIASNIGRALVTLTLAFAPSWPVLVALVLLRSSVDAFYTPAKQAAIQALTPTEALMSANGLSHAINQSSKIIAPALGGALLIALAPSQVFFLNACVSLLAAALMLRMAPLPQTKTEQKQSMIAAVREGFSTIRNNAPLRSVLIIMAAGYFAMFTYDTLIAPLTKELDFTETLFGLSMAAIGAGGLIGALLFGLGKGSPHPFLLISIGAALSSILIGTLGAFEIGGWAMHRALFLAIFFAVGFATTMVIIPVRTIIQQETTPTQIARVTAIGEATNTTALLTAPFIGAAIASVFSVGVAFVVGGVIMLGLAVWVVSIARR